MNKEEFIKYTDKMIKGIYSKVNEEEKDFLNALIMTFNNLAEKNDKAIEITNKIIEEYKLNYGNKPSKLLMALNELSKALGGKNDKSSTNK